MRKIRAGWMYPDMLNLHGERGSVQMFAKVGELLGVEVEIRRLDDFEERIPLEELDILIFLPGEISSFQYLLPSLRRQEEELRSFVERDGYVLALGTTGLMFGKSVTREDGSVVDGLGMLDMTAVERKFVWGDDLYLAVADSDMELMGSQIMMADVKAENPFGKTIYGRGNDCSGAEGARYHNLIYTNCTGPLLVKNPWLAEKIIRDICQESLPPMPENALYTNAKNGFRSTGEFLKTKMNTAQ